MYTLEIEEAIKEYLREVTDHLSATPMDERLDIAQSVKNHIYDALSERGPAEPTMDDLQAILLEMDPPSSYGRATESENDRALPRPAARPSRSIRVGALVVLAGLGLFLGLRLSKRGTSHARFSEPWREQWSILANADEPNVRVPGHHPMGWIRGELPPGKYSNRPPYEGKGLHAGLLAIHPLTDKEPARIRYEGSCAMQPRYLVVEASGNVQGDAVLACVVGGKRVAEYILGGDQWTTCVFDVGRYCTGDAVLELWGEAGGKDPWHFEHVYIDDIHFASARP